MGYRSDVTIMCEEKAYEMFKEAWGKVDFKPNHIYVSEKNNQYTLQWNWVKWYEDYEQINEITKVMDNLDKHEEEEGHAYKIILIGEDNAIEERKNKGAWNAFEDFVVDVNLPSDNKEIEE